MKNGFTPREVARFLLAEKPAHFPDLGDVLHNEAVLMKCLAAQPETYKSYRPRLCVRYDVLNGSQLKTPGIGPCEGSDAVFADSLIVS
jgi:hypothetical protein